MVRLELQRTGLHLATESPKGATTFSSCHIHANSVPLHAYTAEIAARANIDAGLRKKKGSE